MKNKTGIYALAFLVISFSFFAGAGAQTVDYKSMVQRINRLAAAYPALCSVKSVGKTHGGNDIWVLTIGSSNPDSRPAIAVAGGVDGSYVFTRDIALGFAENILKDSESPGIKDLLGKITFYVFPDVSPDASAQYFAEVKYERTLNGRNADDDRDFSTGEDPYEDLNRDGLITQIRVEDPAGKWTESTDDNRLMTQAELARIKQKLYSVYSEGTDNDKDGLFNEDGTGGVDFNRNFTYNYEEFGTGAGLHPVSEPESKAVADFLFDHFNIYAVICFGPQDNLGQPSSRGGERPSAGAFSQPAGQQQTRNTGDRRLTSVLRSDETVIKIVSDKYHEITGFTGAPPSKNNPGSFSDWAYFHYGRYSFTTPGWWINPDKGKSLEATLLKMSDENKVTGVFVPWTEIKHPDFPGKKVEVGGIAPFALTVPPSGQAEEIITKNYKFITAVAEMHPELEFTDVSVENAGSDIFRVSLKVHNAGIFATCAEAGDNNIFTRIMRISAEPAKGQNIISGQKVQRIQRLEGNSTAEYSWLVSGKGRFTVTAGALNTGTITTSFDLK
ncbi:MAG: hypothetical protein GYA43_01090 [Bacteroidales bacterium]|nr:hypothetical protein [Bacteroidales bacterium]